MLNNPRLFKWAAIGLGILVIGVTLYLRVQSLGSRTPQNAARTVREDPLILAQGLLRQSSSLSTCRTALQQVNSHLAQHPDERLPSLSPAARAELAPLNLTEEELAEIESPSFTLLDGLHLEQALLMRDAAESLAPRGLAITRRPEEEAADYFAWVVRQVQIAAEPEPDLGTDAGIMQMPPQLVLRRGLGSPLVRALLFLNMLDQSGYDGCLVTFPRQAGASPRYWACGVLGTGNKIYLFDPRMGMPLPGADGTGIASLDLLTVKDSPVLKQLDLGKEGRLDVTPEIAAGAELHLAPPLSALAPRMSYLEKSVLADMGVRLSSRWSESAEKFSAALAAIGHKGQVKLADWAVRIQRRFFPTSDGGADRGEYLVQFRRNIAYRGGETLMNGLQKVLPAQFVPSSDRDIGPPLDIIFHLHAKHFTDFYLGPDQPRDQILRGNFDEASRTLGVAAGYLQIQHDGYRNNFDSQVETFRAWFTEASKVWAAPGETLEGRTRAAAQVAKRYEHILEMLVNGAAAEELLVHVAFLRAVIKHEEAERLQMRLGATPRPEQVAEADAMWKAVLTLWKEFIYQPQESFFRRPARYLQACAMQRAVEAAMNRVHIAPPADRPAMEEQRRNSIQTAIGFWQDLAGERTDVEALGYRYRVRQLQKQLNEK
jgi:hypothetical protein